MSEKKDYAAIVDLSKRAGGLLIAKTLDGQKRYQWRRDLPTPLQLELNCLRRRSKKRLKKLSHLVVFTRKNNYHIRQKLDLFDLHRAVELLLLQSIKLLSALDSIQIVSRFAAFLLAQFKIIETINKQKPRELNSTRLLFNLYPAFSPCRANARYSTDNNGLKQVKGNYA